jgi:wobble nucleotide-excising tRNase
MTIERIVRLRDHGVFRDFSWPNDLTEFGRYNLLYGWNGSGKTTLSRLLRDLELRRVPAKGEVHLRVNGGDLRGADFPQASLQIRVFNRDFIQESVFPVGGGDVPPIFVVGTESVEKQKEADRLKTNRAAKEQERTAAHASKQAAEREFERHCIERARIIKSTLQQTGSAYNNYNRTDYQGQAQQMEANGDADSHRLSDNQRHGLLAKHQASRKPKLTEVAHRFPDLQAMAGRVDEILKATVVSLAIQALKDNSALAEWVRHGLSLHKSPRSDNCHFCEQPLPVGRLDELEAHFNAEYERFMQRIGEQIRALEAADSEAAAARTPNQAELYDDLGAEFGMAKRAFRQEVDGVRQALGILVRILRRKKDEPFAALSLSEAVPTVDTTAIGRLNEVVRRHNQTCDDFDRHVSEARDRLASAMIAETLDEFARLRDAAQTAIVVIEPIEAEIRRLTAEIERLAREIGEHRRPAEELNEDLKRYLGHDELQLTIKDNGYSISRNGIPADLLSEGEMSAISLLYFLKSLEQRGFDKHTSVVVLDDPVSSLDGNALFLAFGLIRERTKDAGQLILMTHDFAMFRQARNWFHKLPGQRKLERARRPARFFMVECVSAAGVRGSTLRWIDRLLEEYESEYHYLFACVHRAWTMPTSAGLEAYYHIPNVARRLLESFLAFKVPDASGELYNALQLVSFDGDRKTRILRFLHTQSHGSGLVPSHDPSGLGECPAVLSDLFELMRSLDDRHVAAMIELVTAAADGGTTNDA